MYTYEAPHTDTLHYLQFVSGEAARRISGRLKVEDEGIPTRKLPVGGISGITDLREFFNNARQGFRLARIDLKDLDVCRLYQQTVGISPEPKKPSASIDKPVLQLAAFNQIAATLGFLATQRECTFERVCSPHLPPTDSLRSQRTFWYPGYDAEHIWDFITRAQQATQDAMWQEGFVSNPDRLLEVGHFFAAGEYIASRVTGIRPR